MWFSLGFSPVSLEQLVNQQSSPSKLLRSANQASMGVGELVPGFTVRSGSLFQLMNGDGVVDWRGNAASPSHDQGVFQSCARRSPLRGYSIARVLTLMAEIMVLSYNRVIMMEWMSGEKVMGALLTGMLVLSSLRVIMVAWLTVEIVRSRPRAFGVCFNARRTRTMVVLNR